jgi:hypothetical protein
MSCDGENEPTSVRVPGTLVVSLSTPNMDDGAILLSIGGGGMGAPATTSSSYVLHHRATGLSSMNIVLVGNLVEGPLLRFDVPDVGQASSYTATVAEVADRSENVRVALTDYRLEIAPQGDGSP